MIAQTFGIFGSSWNLPVEYDEVIEYAESQGYTLPSITQQVAQAQLIEALQQADIWDDLQTFYVFANNGSAEFGNINWKNPGSFNALIRLDEVYSVAPTWVSNQGYDADLSNASYIGTNKTYNNSSSPVTDLNYSIFGWAYSYRTPSGGGDTGLFGLRPPTNPSRYTWVNPNYGSLVDPYNAQFDISDYNSPFENIVLDGPNKTGLWQLDISGTNPNPVKKVYYQGSTIATGTGGTDLLPTSPQFSELIFLAAGNHVGYSKDVIAIGGDGVSLGDTKAAALNTAVSNYMNSL
jgi:hypothetical protein